MSVALEDALFQGFMAVVFISIILAIIVAILKIRKRWNDVSRKEMEKTIMKVYMTYNLQLYHGGCLPFRRGCYLKLVLLS